LFIVLLPDVGRSVGAAFRTYNRLSDHLVSELRHVRDAMAVSAAKITLRSGEVFVATAE